MALEPVGIRATIEGLNQYLSGTRQMADSTARVGTAANQVEQASTKARGPLSALGSVFGTVAKIAAGFIVAKGLLALPGLFSRIVGAASDLGESINAVQVIFGPASAAVLEFGKNAAESVGLSQRAFNELATPLGALLKNAGLSIDEVGERTIELSKRAADMASVFNVDVGDALGAIQAALRGETEPIRRFGVSLDAAAIAAEAQALGLAKSSVNADALRRGQLAAERAQIALTKAVKEHGDGSLEAREAEQSLRDAQEKLTAARKGDSAELTQGMKLQAAYSLIMKQSAAVQDDFANTADSAANRTRILQARQENLRAELGQRFLPLQIKFLEIQNQIVSVIISRVVPAVDKLIKVVSPAASAIGRLISGLPEAFAKLPVPIQAIINPLAAVILHFDRLKQVFEPIVSLFASGFSGATIGGEFSTIERAAFNMGKIVSGTVQSFRDLGTAAGELFHLFQVGLAGGTIGGEFTAAERAAFEFGTVIREDVIPAVTAIAGFLGALVLEITNVIRAVGEFARSSGLLETFGLGVLTLVQGFIKFVSLLADVLRPIVSFFRENELARTILAVVAVIALLVSGVGTIPVAIAGVIVAIGFLRKNFEDITNFINRYVIGGIMALVDAYLFMPRQLIGVGTEIAEVIVGGIERANDLLRGVPGKIVGWIKDGFVGYHRLLFDIGRAIVQGVWDGIQANKDWFLRKIGEFFTGAVDFVKDKLGIGSPSKEGFFIGEMFALGVQQGIQSGASGVQQASASLLGDLRRLWNDNREFEPIIADVRRITGAANRPDLAHAFEQAWRQLASWARSQPESSGQGTPQQQQAYLAEWNMRKNDLFRTIEQAAGGSGAAISDFSQTVSTSTKGYATAASGMNTAVESGGRVIVGTINGFTAAAGKALSALGSLSYAPGGSVPGTSPSTGSAPSSQSFTRTIAAGYAYGKAPPPPPPAPTTTSAPAAPPSVVVYGTPSAELLALTHAAVDRSFAQAEGQSVRQGALLPNGIG